MKKILAAIFSLSLISPIYAEEMTYEEFFLQTIQVCKDKELYQEAVKESKNKKDGVKIMKAIDCYCNNFKSYSEDEIMQKYLIAMEYGIPQIDLANSLTKAQQCVIKIENE